MATTDSTQQDLGRRTKGMRRKTSVATRLAISALVVSIGSLVIATLVASTTAGNSADDLSNARVNTISGAKAAELESFFRIARGRVAALASSEMTAEAILAFDQGYATVDQVPFEDVREETTAQVEFYLDEFIPELEEVRGAPVDPTTFGTAPSSAAAYLQAKYIADNPADPGERQIITDAGDGSEWTAAHKQFHPIMRTAVDRLEFTDIYLISPNGKTVVYTTNKEVEFATSLESGPHGSTTFAHLIGQVAENGEPGVVAMADYGFHAPSLDQPALFMATPVDLADGSVGVLAAKVDRDEIAHILERDWQAGRLGETGEVYLIGPDERFRSDARLFVEDPEAYLARIDELGLVTEADRNRMESLGTTISSQPVDSEASAAATSGETGRLENTSYLGQTVLTAYQPLTVPGLNWAIMVEQETAEVGAGVVNYRRRTTIVTAIFVVGLTFFIVAWANAFVNPVRAISAALDWIREKRVTTSIPVAGVREFRELGHGLNQMVADLGRRRLRVSDALAQKLAVLQSVLPPAAVERVGVGDRHLLETVPQATVAVLVIEGLDRIVGERSVSAHRALLQSIVETVDGLAEANGLERIKVMGDTYYAVCGVANPYLDHAPRALAFTRQAQQALRGLEGVSDLHLDIAGGLCSGAVTIGLVGNSRLIYDMWGDTVTTATKLARTSKSGEVLVSRSTREHLPAGIATVRASTSEQDASAWVVSMETQEVNP